ncbi:MAG: PilT/PilU family type 4a pilus ATPase [Lentisphaerae bacterium]|nr:PilT/PilU family type 4a pilus ATPase [Lentisphaerota bacterium]
MTPDVPLTIQWFVYALTGNEILSDEDAQNLWESLNRTGDLADFAGNVLESLCMGLPVEEQEAWAGQMQALVDYACQQAESGVAPDGSATGEGEGGDAAEVQFAAVEGYGDLPGLSDVMSLSDEEVRERMITLLTSLRALGCSDLHISAGSPAFVRRLLQIERIDSYVLTPEDAQRLNFSLLSDEQIANFKEEQDVSLALEVGYDRFRVCLMEQKDGVAGSYRLVPDQIKTLEELGFLPKDAANIRRLLDYHNGLILVTGPIGCGKTTTLASMINTINEKRQDHIISVEDPIEILQMSYNCQVSQREVGRHTNSYRSALKASLREDPDIIVIGEMHDLETIENAITASETGHLVIGTLHTGNAANTLNRLLDVFPPAQQPQIRAMTAGSMRGVICQKLVPDGFGGLTLVYELMLNTMAVANIISEGKTFRLQSTMATASKQGMCTFDQCMYEKYAMNLMTREAVLAEMKDQTVIAQVNSLWAQREAQAARANK